METENPSEYIRQILSEYKSPKFDYLPSFTGGLVGYFSYDYLGYKEKSIDVYKRQREYRIMNIPAVIAIKGGQVAGQQIGLVSKDDMKGFIDGVF